MKRKARLARRSFLRGCGALLPLPLLEPMLSRRAQAQDEAPLRWALMYFPHGCYKREMAAAPAADGKPTIPSYLSSALSPIRDELLWVNQLSNDQDGKGGHERAAGCFLNCNTMLLPGPIFSRSADQIIADRVGASYRIPNLVLSAPGYRQAAGCCRDVEVGLNNISFLGGSSPSTKLQSPRQVFNTIFPSDGSQLGHELAELRRAHKLSILDFNRRATQKLMQSVGQTDKHRLEAYFESVRELERRIEVAPGTSDSCVVPSQPPEAVDFVEHNRLMIDLMLVAFQCNATAVASFMMDFEFSDRTLPIDGITTGHHTVSHHGHDPDKVRQYRLFQTFYAERYRMMVEGMKASTDVNGKTMLENSMVMLSSGMMDGNDHNRAEVPMLVAGKAGGAIRSGRVLEAPKPLSAFFKATMRIMGASGDEVDNFGRDAGDLSLS